MLEGVIPQMQQVLKIKICFEILRQFDMEYCTKTIIELSKCQRRIIQNRTQ